MCVCMYVCMYVCMSFYNSRNYWPILMRFSSLGSKFQQKWHGRKKIEKGRKIGAFFAKNVIFCYADVKEMPKMPSCAAKCVLFYARKSMNGLIFMNLIINLSSAIEVKAKHSAMGG